MCALVFLTTDNSPLTTDLPWWPGHVASAEQVQVEMEHRLPCARANVVHRAVSALNAALASDLRGDELAVAEDLSVFRRGFLQSNHVPFGDDQHVRRRLGIDVLEDVHFVVLVHLLRRDLAGDDLAKEAVFIHGNDVN